MICSLAVSADKQIKRSNNIYEDQVLGTDMNRNIVRDDVEDFIRNKLGKKEPSLYRAYFNYAEDLTLFLKHRRDRIKLEEVGKLMTRDYLCILGIDPAPNPDNDVKSLSENITNTKSRQEASNLAFTTLKESKVDHYPKNKWKTLCRK